MLCVRSCSASGSWLHNFGWFSRNSQRHDNSCAARPVRLLWRAHGSAMNVTLIPGTDLLVLFIRAGTLVRMPTLNGAAPGPATPTPALAVAAPVQAASPLVQSPQERFSLLPRCLCEMADPYLFGICRLGCTPQTRTCRFAIRYLGSM